MAGKAIDLAGTRFGSLVAIKRIGTRRLYALWLCKCDCGCVTSVTSGHLRRGAIASCGCSLTWRPSPAQKQLVKRLYAEGKSTPEVAACLQPIRVRTSGHMHVQTVLTHFRREREAGQAIARKARIAHEFIGTEAVTDAGSIAEKLSLRAKTYDPQAEIDRQLSAARARAFAYSAVSRRGA